ncbi:MAG: hypothetical protein ACP5RS_00355 [Thermoplasmata archaeon]
MTVVVRKDKRKNSRVYYRLYDVRRINGKVKSKYVGYPGKNPQSKNEISYRDMIKYVHRLMGIDSNITPVTTIVLENAES